MAGSAEKIDARVSHDEKHDPKGGSHGRRHVMTSFDTNLESLPAGYFRSSLSIGTMLAAAFGPLAGVAGFGYAAPILGIINADTDPNPNLAWTVLVYTLMLSVFLTLVSRTSDIFGRRWFSLAVVFRD